MRRSIIVVGVVLSGWPSPGLVVAAIRFAIVVVSELLLQARRAGVVRSRLRRHGVAAPHGAEARYENGGTR